MTAPTTQIAEDGDDSALTGRVLWPGDPGFVQASRSWNRLFDHSPRVIVFAGETADVVNALAWARRSAVPVRVRSGRHSLEGWSNVDDGIVIDVSELKSAAIDVQARTATVGAGLTQLEAVTALGEAGFVAPTGTEGTVGLVGATLGGGFGLLTRAFGMASDNLLAVEIVIASSDGGAEVVAVDEHTRGDLLWALRGAGNGSFGIVTALTYAVHPLGETTYLTASWTGLDQLAGVFAAWQACAPFADDGLTSQLEITQGEIRLVAALTSGDPAEAQRMLGPVLWVGTPSVSVTVASWADTYAAFQIPLEDEPANWRFASQFAIEPFPAEAIEVIGSFLAAAPTAECNYFANAFGGAVATSEPSGGSAFAHRDALFYAEPGAGWGEREHEPTASADLTSACLQWVADFAAALAPFVNGAYVNVPNAGMSDWETAYWGANVDRLRAVKSRYDPENVFDFAQGIAPVEQTGGPA